MVQLHWCCWITLTPLGTHAKVFLAVDGCECVCAASNLFSSCISCILIASSDQTCQQDTCTCCTTNGAPLYSCAAAQGAAGRRGKKGRAREARREAREAERAAREARDARQAKPTAYEERRKQKQAEREAREKAQVRCISSSR
jgi:hypothetical protein